MSTPPPAVRVARQQRWKAAVVLAAVWLSATTAADASYLAAAGRSPIPQPGETFDKPIPAERLVAERRTGRPAAPEAPGEVVPWDEAHGYVGKRITVEGKILSTRNLRGQLCFLNFTPRWQGGFYVPVFNDVFGELPEPPETYFKDKTIRVTGEVTVYRNNPNIEVRSIDQIQVVE